MGLFSDKELARNIERLSIPFNEYGIDPFGVSKKSLQRFYTPFAQIYRHYLRVTSFGMEHVPSEGRALIISNHSGGIGADAAMIITSQILNEDSPRIAHGMAEYFFNKWPFVSPLMDRVGHLTGIPEHAVRLLEADRLVVAFPEGARGTGKLYKDRYELVRFGTGFMRLALKTKSPVIPTAFIGGEEAFPTLFHIKWLANLTKFPCVPVAPQLVLWPLPVSCQIYYGLPMHFEGTGTESDTVINDYVAQVREEIEHLIKRGLEARPSAFSLKRMPDALPTNIRSVGLEA